MLTNDDFGWKWGGHSISDTALVLEMIFLVLGARQAGYAIEQNLTAVRLLSWDYFCGNLFSLNVQTSTLIYINNSKDRPLPPSRVQDRTLPSRVQASYSMTCPAKLPRTKEEELQERSNSLRVELKTWEKTFASANGGKKASREDIKNNPHIGTFPTLLFTRMSILMRS